MRVIDDKNQISEDVFDFMISHLPFPQKSICPELANLFSSSIILYEITMEGGDKGMNPVTMIVINPQHEYLPSRGLNQLPPDIKCFKLQSFTGSVVKCYGLHICAQTFKRSISLNQKMTISDTGQKSTIQPSVKLGVSDNFGK